MNNDKLTPALETKFDSLDLGSITARDYLKALLSELLVKGESFSGKRPFGNSGWEHELANPLITAGVIEGSIDDEGYATPESEDEYIEALEAMVEAL